MVKTLQDFILCNVSETESRQFHKVLASNPVTGAESDDLARLLEKFYQAKDNDVWDKIFGPDSDPFDMTPEELERLTRVQRDPRFQIEFSLPLTGKNKDQLKEIQTTVNRFMMKNGVYFDTFKDVFVDTEERELNYSGRKELAEELLKQLEYSPLEIKKILQGKYNRYGTKKAPVYYIPISALGDPKVLTRPKVSLLLTQFIKGLKKKEEEPFILRTLVRSPKQKGNAPENPGIHFEGQNLSLLELFLGPDGLDLPQTKIKEILGNLNKYKV